MGCDIHVHLEVKLEGSIQWQHMNQPRIGRDYELFEMIAGVRGDGLGVVVPTGVPMDASRMTAFDYGVWGSDAHSAGWLTWDEIREVEKRHKVHMKKHLLPHNCGFCSQLGYLFGDSVTTEYVEDLPDGLQDVRLIFWFDN